MLYYIMLYCNISKGGANNHFNNLHFNNSLEATTHSKWA